METRGDCGNGGTSSDFFAFNHDASINSERCGVSVNGESYLMGCDECKDVCGLVGGIFK